MLPIFAMVGGVAAVPVPTVTNVQASGGAVGDIDGNYLATFTGTNFVLGATSFAVGGTAVTGVLVTSTTSATGTMPAKAPGSYAVTATTAGGTSTTNGTFEYYSPATEVLSAWWRAPWASPETATASAGTSAAAGNLSAGAAPSFATLLNGKAVADWNGSTNNMTNAAVVDTALLSLTGGWSGFAIANPDAAGAASAGSAYNEAAVWSDNGQGYQQLTFSTRGWTISRYDGNGSGLWQEATVACAPGAWRIVFFGWDGTNLWIQLDGGAPVVGGTLASPMITSGAPLVVGRNFSSNYFDGKHAELVFAKTNLYGGSTPKTKARGYARTRYQITV